MDPSSRAPEVQERHLRSFDGTELAFHVVDQQHVDQQGATEHGDPILLCNGLGGSWMAWTHQISYFADRHPFISWDYRGLYRSGPPPSLDALRIEDHAQDGFAVLDALEIDRAIVIGWSMGVQVALEMALQHPERVKLVILLNGVAGNPYRATLGLGKVGDLLPPLVRGAGKFPRLAEKITRTLVARPDAVQWAKRIGIAAKTLDAEIFNALAGSFADLDMRVYMRIMELLSEHDAEPRLPGLHIPTLVITGDRDLMTPQKAAKRMADAIPDSEFMVVRGGTHYAAVEYPDLINLRIEKFLQERAGA